ncbi:hypothetical protein ACLQ2Q_15880 [Microbacterium sp. DT81.1]|uniref:hypothetical protein n=1 Tax=Microbacterium sp. DT81.1 TaxID=3393413 RepID=UPI003CF80957
MKSPTLVAKPDGVPVAKEVRNIPQSVKAIALDTNAGSRGLLNLEAIDELIDVINAQELQVEIWIPEPVMWEWAEHAHDLAMTTKAVAETASRRLERSGIAEFAKTDYSLTIDEVIDIIEDRLSEFYLEDGSEAVRVLRLESFPDAAVNGIRDQVLRLGAGRTKPDGDQAVKTGAADSASWRLITDAASSLDEVALVTADSDAARHFVSGSKPVIVRDIWAAKNALLRLTKPSVQAVKDVALAIQNDLPQLSEADLYRAHTVGGLPSSLIPARDSSYDPTVRVLGIDRVLEVENIEVSRADETATAIAVVEVHIVVDFLRWDAESESLESDQLEDSGIRAVAQVSAESGGKLGGPWYAWVDDLELHG